MDSFSDVWELVAHHCKTQLSDMVYDLWIKCIEPVKLENDTALLYVRSKFQQDLINEKYLEIIKQGFESVLGFPVAVQITCDAMVKGDGAAAKEENKQPEEALNQVGIGGDYDYTFASFIVGSSNNFAHAAAMAVAANPSNVYNPLFIYGDSGLGKTHLLFAICNEVKKNNPQANIVYVKGEEFTNEMISAIGSGTTMEFRNKYRVADVLLIDDIQFIGGKISTQEEFFHTFETLFQSHKQIVLSSDRPPKEIKTLEDRLRSRFESGLLADIHPPDFETRIAIIRRKAELLGLDLPSDVTEFIANRIKNNIRQLEGAVKKINAYKMLEGISHGGGGPRGHQGHPQRQPAHPGDGGADHQRGVPHLQRLPPGHQEQKEIGRRLPGPPGGHLRHPRGDPDAHEKHRRRAGRAGSLHHRLQPQRDEEQAQEKPAAAGDHQRHHQKYQEIERPPKFHTLSPGRGKTPWAGKSPPFFLPI